MAIPTRSTFRIRRPSAAHGLAWFGLLLGPGLCLLLLWLLPVEFGVRNQIEDSTRLLPFSWAGRATLGVMVWMGVWWLTEAVHISVTALLPIVLFPLLGISSISDASHPYSDPLVFLYMGGFVIALSMERWGLGKRMALLTLNFVGTSAASMVAGFMIVTAALSSFVSNTATTAMMLPIALSVVALLRKQTSSDDDVAARGLDRFAICLMLTIAYSASIGGMLTVIGTPTNAFLIGFLSKTIAPEFRQDISFVGWLPIGGPVVALFLPIMYLLMTRWLLPIRSIELSGGKQLIRSELRALGTVQRGEWNTLIVFAIAVGCWLLRPVLSQVGFDWQGVTMKPLANLTDTGVAMSCAMLLFLLPTNWQRREFTMDWATAERLPWGILLLFGGGLSLASAVEANGVAEFIGSQSGAFGKLQPWLLVLLVTTGVMFLTELTSNAATTASLVPVLAAIAPGLGIHPYLLIIPATLAASCAFMLPVATPPNAIVFGSGLITIPQMVRTGFFLNLVGIVIITLMTMLVIRPWLAI